MTTVAQRNLYIDSEIVQTNGTSFRLSLPPAAFSCKANQMMKLSLTNFEMRKNWYEVNNTNNIFWIKITLNITSRYFPVVIPPGSYRTFGTTSGATNAIWSAPYLYATNDLCSAIAYAFNKTFSSLYENRLIYDSTGVVFPANQLYNVVGGYPANAMFISPPTTTVSFNSVTRKFTAIFPTFSTNYSITDVIYLQCKNGLPPTHPISPFIVNFNSAFGDPIFQDCYELIGGVPTRDDSVSVNNVALGNIITNNRYISPYVGQLNTMEALYLRIQSLGTNSYQSPGLDRNVTNNSYGLVPSNIFARIPLETAIYDDTVQIITYTEQGGGTFSVLVDARTLQLLDLSITDDKGRPLTQVAINQASSGNLSAKITVKWEVIQFDQSITNIPASMDVIKSLQPVGFTRPGNDFMPPSTSRDVNYKDLNKITPRFEPRRGNLDN